MSSARKRPTVPPPHPPTHPPTPNPCRHAISHPHSHRLGLGTRGTARPTLDEHSQLSAPRPTDCSDGVRPPCEPLLRLLRSTDYRVAAQAGAYATGSLRGWPQAPSSRANRTCAAMVAFGTNGHTGFCAHNMHCRVQHVPLRLAARLRGCMQAISQRGRPRSSRSTRSKSTSPSRATARRSGSSANVVGPGGSEGSKPSRTKLLRPTYSSLQRQRSRTLRAAEPRGAAVPLTGSFSPPLIKQAEPLASNVGSPVRSANFAKLTRDWPDAGVQARVSLISADVLWPMLRFSHYKFRCLCGLCKSLLLLAQRSAVMEAHSGKRSCGAHYLIWVHECRAC